MDRFAKARFEAVWSVTQTDKKYMKMLDELRALDKRYDQALMSLPDEQRDAVCDFVTMCEAMSERMLEIACCLMVFPVCQEEK